MNKVEALQKVIADMRAYNAAKRVVVSTRTTLFESIRTAKLAKATQQQIADCTADDESLDKEEQKGLSRQRIAQIIDEGE